MSTRPAEDREDAQVERNPSPSKAAKKAGDAYPVKEADDDDELPRPQPPVKQTSSLLDDIMKFSAKSAQAMNDLDEMSVRSVEMAQRCNRARRKSRSLETDLFGCLLSDMNNLRASFDSVDTDKSGTIDKEELQEALRKAGKRLSIDECKEMIARVDQNGSGELSFEEFHLIFTGKTPPAFRVDSFKPTVPPAPMGQPPAAPAPATTGSLKYEADTEAFRYSFTPRVERPQ